MGHFSEAMMRNESGSVICEAAEADDGALIGAFADSGSKAAFEAIVERHARWVYAAAYRQLRELLGAGVSEGSLTTAAAFGAPVGSAALCAQVSHVALGVAAGGPVPAGVAPAMKGAVYLMAMTKAKIAAAVAIIALVVGTSGGMVAWKMLASTDKPATDSTTAPAPAQVQTFEEVYVLRGDEVLRRIPPPFVKARMDFYRKAAPVQAKAILAGPDGMILSQWNGKPFIFGATFGDRRGYHVGDLVHVLLNVSALGMEGDKKILDSNISGDFILKHRTDPEVMRAAMEKMISHALGYPVSLTYREVDRPVIVFKGKWQAKNADGTDADVNGKPPTVEIFGADLNRDRSAGGGSGDVAALGGSIGAWIGKIVIVESTDAPLNIAGHYNDVGDGSGPSRRHANDVDLVCRHIQEQTGLTWSNETRQAKILFIERGKQEPK